MSASKGSLADGTKIPTWWKREAETGDPSPNRTLVEIQQKRRKAEVPDMTFDLDGDGIVGNRDMFIAKIFDKDGDGRLNTQERSNADHAIKNVSES